MLDYWKLCASRFGLGFNQWCNLFLAYHLFIHISCIRTLSFLFLDCDCDLFLSLSLFQIDCTWHPSANLLRLRTLLVLGLLLLLIPFPLFMFGSMMGRPSRTSLRTFRNVAFIRSAMSFCRTFLTFLYPVSFGLGDGNFFVRYPWGALSCLYKIFIPIYTVLIPLYLGLPRHFEVHAL